MRKALSSLFVAALILPLISFAQAPDSTPVPPAFLEGVTTPEQFQALTPEQQAEAQAYYIANPPVPSVGTGVNAPEDAVSCFDYYTFGSVQVDIEPVSSVAVAGTPFAFVGTITNNNPYPIVDGAVYVKIFKLEDDASSAKINGNAVTDQFFVARDIKVTANGTTSIEIPYDVPVYSQSGTYEIATYFMTHDRFNLLGLPFTDDITGNRASFIIEGGVADSISFDKNRVYFNTTPFSFAAFPPHFSKDETVVLSVPIVNTTGDTLSALVQFNLYNWDGLREEQKLDTKNDSVTLAPGEETVLYYEATKATGAVSFIRATLSYNDTTSILNTRFVRDDIAETRLNFPSITTYPLKAGEESTLFSCVHSTNLPLVEGNTLTLTLADAQGKKIHSYTYEGGVTGAMMAVKDSFTPRKTLTDFTLTASLSRDGQVVEEVTNTYRCTDIDPSLCEAGATAGEEKTNILVVLVIALLLITLIIMVLKRFGFFAPTLAVAFILIALAAVAPQAEAKSVTWTSGSLIDRQIVSLPISVPSTLVSRSRNSGTVPLITPGSYGGSTFSAFGYGANYTVGSLTVYAPSPVANAQIVYKAILTNADTGTVLSDNTSLPVGTRVRLQRNTSTLATDARFYGQVNNWAGEYGPITTVPFSKNSRWITGAGPVTSACMDQDFLWRGKGYNFLSPEDWDHYVLMNVNPPATNVVVVNGPVSCSGDVCTITGAGLVTLGLNFSETYSNIYTRTFQYYSGIPDSNNPDFVGCYGVNAASSPQLTIPAQSITFNLTGTAPAGAAPTAPLIRGNSMMTASALATSSTGVSVPFYFRADDPDNDTIKYEFKWNDISASSSLPTSGHVADLTVQNTSRTFSTAGTYTLRVIAIDSVGNLSPATTHSITVSAPTIPAVPAAPTSATAGSCDTGAISVAWTSVSGATGYDLQYRTGTGAWTTLTSVTSPHNVTGLTAGASYEFQVRAKNTAGTSAWSPSRTATAPSACTVPTTTIFTAPTSCTIASGASSCNVTLSWNLTGHPSPSIRNNSTAVTVSTAVTSAGTSVTLPYRATAYTFEARSNTTTLSGTTRNISTNCASGLAWNGSICAATPPPTATLVATKCTVPAGGSTCSTTLNWNAVGTVSPWEIIHTNKTPSPEAVSGVSGSSGSVSYTVRYGTQSFVLKSGSADVASASMVASCASGSSWNGTRCQVSGPTVTFNVPPSCTIPLGENSCNVTISWDLTGQTMPSIRNVPGSSLISTALVNSGLSVRIQYRNIGTTLTANSGTTILASSDVITNCASGLGWTGSSCEPLPPGTVTIFTADSGCIIPDGRGTCTVNLNWDLTGHPLPTIHYVTSGRDFSYNQPTGSMVATLSYRSTPQSIQARSNYIPLLARPVTTTCAAGTDWDNVSGSCTSAPTPPPPPPPPPPTTSFTVNTPLHHPAWWYHLYHHHLLEPHRPNQSQHYQCSDRNNALYEPGTRYQPTSDTAVPQYPDHTPCAQWHNPLGGT